MGGRFRRSWVSLLLLLALACSQASLPFTTTSPQSPPAGGAIPADLPPVVVDFAPKRGAEVAPEKAVLRLHFDRPMDRPSVEAALTIRPAVRGEISWPDDRTLVFRPQGLASATRYHVSLGGGVRAADGVTMTKGVEFVFQTVAPLAVTDHLPVEADDEVRVDAPLFITFNYPLVPINCTGQEAGRLEGCPLLELRTDPPVQTRGFWVDTATYRADPVPGWQAGTAYEVTLAPPTALNGATMASPFRWHFATARPRLLDSSPPPEARDVPLETGVLLRFNTPMDQAATGGAFSLVEEGGAQVAGTIVWGDDGAQMVFTPTQPLKLDTTYFIHLAAARARALTGAPLDGSLESRFHTVPPARLLKLSPQDGARDVPLYESVALLLDGAIDVDSVLPHVTITPSPPDDSLYTRWHDKTFYISWQMEPRTRYCVKVEPGIADRYGNQTAEAMESCFTTGDAPSLFLPMGAMQGNFVTLDAEAPPIIYAVQRNMNRMPLTLQALSGPAGSGETIRSWREAFDAPPNQVTAEAIHLSRADRPLPTGYYRLLWEEDGWEQSLLLAVIDRHLTVRLSTQEALVRVTDLHSGVPIAGAEVRLLGEKGRLLAGGTTDADGMVRVPLSGIEQLWNVAFVESGEAGTPGFGVAINGARTGNGFADTDIDYAYGKPAPYVAYLYTDRPIYRPGDEVHWRLIVREEREDRYALPPMGAQVRLRLDDCQPDDAPLETMVVALSDLGTASGSFVLPEEAEPCPYYRIAPVMVDEREEEAQATMDVQGGLFAVAAYRKPAFEVDVVPQMDDWLQGASLQAEVKTAYYFGGPVNDAAVHWRLIHLSQPLPSPLGWGWNATASSCYGCGYIEETVAEGEGRTDKAGRFFIETPLTLPKPKHGAPLSAQLFRVEAQVVDEGGFPVGGEAEIRVHPARFEVGVRPQQQIGIAGEKLPVALRAVDWYGAPIAHRPLTVTLARRTWYRDQRPGEFMPTWHYTDTVVADFDVRTDVEGRAEIFVTPPKAGPYVIKVEGRDDEGNLAYAENFLWVSGPEGAAWQQEDNFVKPVADASRYRPGETAHILLPTPFTGPYHVLMTVERSGILDVQQFVTDTANPVFDLPIIPAYAPNVYVSFVGVQTSTTDVPQIVVGTVEVKVEPTAQRLRLTLQTDRAEYAPGETVQATVGVYDAQGNPVDAEIGLAVVDKAVLALAEEQAPDIETAFYGEKPLRVVGGDSLSTLANRWTARFERLQQEAELYAAQALGGMGGGGGGAVMPEIRRNFPDTAFWKADVRTGPQGEVVVDVPLPDSLTTWVLDGRAVTADTKVGQADVEIVATKPFFVRPLTPRFFVAGDEAEVGAIVHNNTDHRLAVDVQLMVEGADLHSEATQSLTLAAGGRGRVDWRIAVPSSGSEAVLLTFAADGGGYSDRVRPTVGSTDAAGALPVRTYHSADVMGTGGAMMAEGSRLEAIVVPPEAGDATYLDVAVAPSLVAEMTMQMEALEAAWDDECTEAIVSHFLPNAYLYLALTQAQVAAPELAEQLPPLVNRSLRRLYGRQREDGGWGWAGLPPEEESNLQLSAYVTLGMLTAKAAGLSVDATHLDAALAFLRQRLLRDVAGLRARPLDAEDALAFYVYTLGEEAWPEGMASAFYDSRDALGVTGRAYLTLALGIVDRADRRVAVLLDRLRSEAFRSANGAHWEESESALWLTDLRATAVAVKVLANLAPDDPLLPDAVRWLIIARSARPWMTTQEMAWSMMGMLDVAVATGELQGAYSWGLSLNGHAVASGSVTPETVREATTLRLGLAASPAEGLVRERTNALEIARGRGPGVLYYTAHFVVDEPAERVEPESRGLAVERHYCDPFRSDEALCVPPEEIRAGDLVEVRLKVTVPSQRYFVDLTDFYPAGMEPVDPTLLTETEGENPAPRWWWWGAFDAPRLLDDRALFTARSLAAGSYEVRYLLRATFYGRYRVLPALARERYFPDVWGRSQGETLTILP